MVLTRSLVSLTHRSLYLGASQDPGEHYERHQLTAHEERKHLEAIINEVPSLAPTLDLVRKAIAAREQIFDNEAWSLRPIFPTDEQVARELGLAAHYDEVYRSGSGHMHFTAISAVGALAFEEGEQQPIVALYGHDVNELRQAMISAIVVYADFLIEAERVVGLDVGPKIEAMRPTLAAPVAEAKAELSEEPALNS